MLAGEIPKTDDMVSDDEDIYAVVEQEVLLFDVYFYGWSKSMKIKKLLKNEEKNMRKSTIVLYFVE
jgi:hypothetical protein